VGHEKDKNKNKPGLPARWVIVYKGPDGQDVTEPGGENDVSSRALRVMREDAVAQGTWQPRKKAGQGGNTPFWEYELKHSARRVAQGKSLAVDGTEHGNMVNHVVPRIGHLTMLTFGTARGREVICELIAELRTKDLAPATILNIYGQLRVLFSWAVKKDKVCSASPCTLETSMDELPKDEDKNPRWRQQANFAR